MKYKLTLLIVAILVLGCSSSQQRAGAEDTSLENTYWKLVEVDGRAVTTSADGPEVYMTLTRDGGTGRLQGHAGCNGLGGDYKVDGNTIKLQPITTRMYCEALMEVENLFTKMLSVADNYRVAGQILELYTGKELLGKFEAKPAGK